VTCLLWTARRIGAIGMAAIAAVPMASKAETSRSFQVTAAIVKGCVVATDASAQLGRIDFGTVPGTARGPTDATLLSGSTSGIAIECTPDTDVTITADLGEHASGGVRRLGLNGGNQDVVAYQLYADGSTTAWTTQALSLRFASGATSRTMPIVGRAQLTGAMAAGSYSDTVRVTVAW
jgi:spore coat protein U-like protein